MALATVLSSGPAGTVGCDSPDPTAAAMRLSSAADAVSRGPSVAATALSSGPPSERLALEDHDSRCEADDGDHGDGQQRTQLLVAGAEHDCGMVGGDCLAHQCLLVCGCDIGDDHATHR
jgi:hypothetical protein